MALDTALGVANYLALSEDSVVKNENVSTGRAANNLGRSQGEAALVTALAPPRAEAESKKK